MTFYRDRHEMYDGDVVIYRRADSVHPGKGFWWVRFHFSGSVGFRSESLKTKDLADAKARAKRRFVELQQLVHDGAPLSKKTFRQAWEMWFSEMKSAGVWKPARERWHRGLYDRYLEPYFGEHRLNQINTTVCNDYWPWRRVYWQTGPGKEKRKYNRRRAGRKNTSTANAAEAPANKSLEMERYALNQFFRWCYAYKRLVQHPLKMSRPIGSKSSDDRRPGFNASEWQSLTRNLRSWAEGVGRYKKDKISSFHRRKRQQLRFYILFLGSTGVRPGNETRPMRWEDFSEMERSDGTRVLLIKVRKNTKKGVARTVVSMPNVVGWMKEWRKLSDFPEDQDLVWYGNASPGGIQVPIGDLNKTFQNFLRSVPFKSRTSGLLCDSDGDKRTLYSVRHFYASERVLHGVSYEDLSRNMGCGIKQLVDHYDHVRSEQKADEITFNKYRKQGSEITADEILAKISPEIRQELRDKLIARHKQD